MQFLVLKLVVIALFYPVRTRFCINGDLLDLRLSLSQFLIFNTFSLPTIPALFFFHLSVFSAIPFTVTLQMQFHSHLASA